MNKIRVARAENLPFEYFFNTSPHSFPDIFPAYVDDPPAKHQIFAFGLGIHSFSPYALLQPRLLAK
jgi:hypothetical protein